MLEGAIEFLEYVRAAFEVGTLNVISLKNQGPVVQSIVGLTSSLRGQLVKFFTTL